MPVGQKKLFAPALMLAVAQLAAALMLLIIDSFAQGSIVGAPLVSPARARCGGENVGVCAEICELF